MPHEQALHPVVRKEENATGSTLLGIPGEEARVNPRRKVEL